MMRSGGTADAAVGMMDAAYFTGRKELLDFFNDLLDLNLVKIEETASGAVACQLTEYIFPGSIPMSRVNWEAKSDYEFVQNYKLLQASFTKNGVQRHVDVDKLIRAKYQDNLEFCQWLKAFFDQSGVYREDYDPVAVRAKGKGGKKKSAAVRSSGTVRSSSIRNTTSSTASRRTAGTASTRPNKTSRPQKENKVNMSNAATGGGALTDAMIADAQLMKKNSELNSKVAGLETAVAEAEKERDFYFEKLRAVEVLLQVHQEKGEESSPEALVERVFKVLYATPEDNVVVGDDGEFINEEGDPLDALLE